MTGMIHMGRGENFGAYEKVNPKVEYEEKGFEICVVKASFRNWYFKPIIYPQTLC